MARRAGFGILFSGAVIDKRSVSSICSCYYAKVITIQIYKYLVNKYRGLSKKSTIRTTNQSVMPLSFLQTPKVSSNHILGALVEEQRLVLLETEATTEAQEVRQPDKIGVAVVDVDAAVVEALDIVVVDIA